MCADLVLGEQRKALKQEIFGVTLRGARMTVRFCTLASIMTRGKVAAIRK